jgi:hypothetical protein
MQSLPPVKDLLVETNNPDYLDKSVNRFGAAVVGGGMPGGYVKVDGAYVVRCFGNVGFIKFAIENQGYGKVIREFEGLYNDDAFEDIVNG